MKTDKRNRASHPGHANGLSVRDLAFSKDVPRFLAMPVLTQTEARMCTASEWLRSQSARKAPLWLSGAGALLFWNTVQTAS